MEAITPRKGMKYFFIDSDGEIFWDIYDGDEIDNKRLKFGNFFTTRIRATKARNKIKKLLLTL